MTSPNIPDHLAARPAVAPLEVACPRCGAAPLRRCHDQWGRPAKAAHVARLAAAEEAAR